MIDLFNLVNYINYISKSIIEPKESLFLAWFALNLFMDSNLKEIKMNLSYLKMLMAVSAFTATAAMALEQKPVLSLDVAEAIANACLKHQVQTKYSPVNVVVVDDGGLVIISKRQDGACKACGEIAERKARTAALFNLTTRTLETLSYGEKKDGSGAVLPGAPHVPGIIVFPGGVPISAGKLPIGGVGVSGASGDEDEQCALAGVTEANRLIK